MEELYSDLLISTNINSIILFFLIPVVVGLLAWIHKRLKAAEKKIMQQQEQLELIESREEKRSK